MGRSAIEGWVTLETAKAILKMAGQDFDALKRQAVTREFKPVPLNLKASIAVKNALRTIDSRNVLAKLEGSDPQLRDEYVVYTAHWDHLGVGAPNKNGDTIYNGALDNASGVAVVLAIAETIARTPPAQRPKRSSLFLFPTAEEQGLLGAEWYAKHPVVPIDKTAANINLDSMNVLGPTNDFIPLGAERSSLKAVV